jgi:DNA polymerase III delta prime subunit
MNFIGNQKIVKILEKSLRSGKISQAYLFHGPEHVGKFTLAKIFAEGLINNIASLSSEVTDKEINLPDLIIIEPEKEEKRGVIKIKDIKIEQVREAQNQLATYPHSGKFKVLIIDDANKMTVASQNSLLKMLEEPNSTSVIILVAHEIKSIIPTIASRCQKFSFALVDSEEIKQALSGKNNSWNEKGMDPGLGRPGVILNIRQNKAAAQEDQELKIINKVDKIQKMSINEKLDFAEIISKNPEFSQKVMETWIWKLRDEARKDQNKAAVNFQIIEKIEKTLTQASKTNANLRLAIEALLISI